MFVKVKDCFILLSKIIYVIPERIFLIKKLNTVFNSFYPKLTSKFLCLNFVH